MDKEEKVEKNRIFGFRSQKTWKKIIAVIYYIIGILIVIEVLTNWEEKISYKDTIIEKIKEVFTVYLYLSPFILLSDFSKGVRKKIPLLKENNKKKTFLFFLILIVIVGCINGGIVDSYHSEEYNKMKMEHGTQIQNDYVKNEENEQSESEDQLKKSEEKLKEAFEEAKNATEQLVNAIDEEINFKESCETYTYKEIARNPDQFKGKNVKFTGEVMQVSEGFFKHVTILLSVTKNEYGWYEDNVYCDYWYSDGESKILNDDIITIYGTCEEDTSYVSVLGSSITIPKVNIKYVEIK